MTERPEGLSAEPKYAVAFEYPTPETEHGRNLSALLRNHGLDFDRSIYNVELEARHSARPQPALHHHDVNGVTLWFDADGRIVGGPEDD